MTDDMTQQVKQIARDGGSGRKGEAMSAIVSGMTGLADTTTDLEAGLDSALTSLLQAVKSQNREAFEALYDATVQRVLSLALRITRQQELAEEVVSDVYLQVWQKADSYTPQRGKVISWLCVICRSRALDAIRREGAGVRKESVGLDTVAEPEDLNEPPDILASMEQGSAIQVALGKLNEQQRQLVALAYFRGYTHSELAAFLDMPIGTVKTHLHRAMIKLKEMMSSGAGINGESND